MSSDSGSGVEGFEKKERSLVFEFEAAIPGLQAVADALQLPLAVVHRLVSDPKGEAGTDPRM